MGVSELMTFVVVTSAKTRGARVHGVMLGVAVQDRREDKYQHVVQYEVR